MCERTPEASGDVRSETLEECLDLDELYSEGFVLKILDQSQ